MLSIKGGQVMQKWEYKTLISVNDASTAGHGFGATWDMHGGDGWELVSVLPYEDPEIRKLNEQKGLNPEDYFPQYIGFFKRPITEGAGKVSSGTSDLDDLVGGLNQWSTDFENFRKKLPPDTPEDEAMKLFAKHLEQR